MWHHQYHQQGWAWSELHSVWNKEADHWYEAAVRLLLLQAAYSSWDTRVATNSDFDRISNTEYYSFLGIYEYRIPNNIRSWKLTNTEYRILFGQGKFTNTEYRIVLFGLNYSNNELFEHWNGPAYSNFRKECVNLARMIKVIVNNVSAFKIIYIFSQFLSQNVTLQGVF